MSRRHCRLISELIAFKQAEGGSIRSLAEELRVDESAIIRFRSGARSPSKRVLVKIVERYGQLKFVRDLVWHHLAAECREDYAAPEDGAFAGVDLPAGTLHDLRSYVSGFAAEVNTGRGLYLVSGDPALLSVAIRGLARALTKDRWRFELLRADQRVDARGLRAALAATLVLIERIDFASDAVADILRRRADLTRPSIVTSLLSPEDVTDAYLRRIAFSSMRLVAIPSRAALLQRSSPTAVHDEA